MSCRPNWPATARTLAVAVALLGGITPAVVAQSGSDGAADSGTPTPDTKGAAAAVSSFFSRIGSSIESAVSTGPRTKPQIAELKQAPYEVSNEALGDSRDVSQQRLRGFGLVNLPTLFWADLKRKAV